MILTVPCLMGLEGLVADEMKRLGLKMSGQKTAASIATAIFPISPA